MKSDSAAEIRKQILNLTKEYSSVFLKPKSFIAGTDSIPVSGKVLDDDDFVRGG